MVYWYVSVLIFTIMKYLSIILLFTLYFFNNNNEELKFHEISAIKDINNIKLSITESICTADNILTNKTVLIGAGARQFPGTLNNTITKKSATKVNSEITVKLNIINIKYKK